MAGQRVPPGLGPTGQALFRRLTSAPKGETLVFSVSEFVTLEMACKTADDIARLEELLEEQGAAVIGSQGQVKLSGALAELRLQRSALQRLVATLALPDDGEVEAPKPKARQAQKAAQARWAKQARLAQVAKHGTDG